MKTKLLLSLLLALTALIYFFFHEQRDNGLLKSEAPTKRNCSDIESYKNWISTSKETLIPKPYGTGGYLIDSINQIEDNVLYVVTCINTLDQEEEWVGKTSAVLFYSRNSNSFLDFSLMEQYINFESTGDINGNDVNDVIIEMANGGNCWSCEWKEIFEVKDDKVILLTKGINNRSTNSSRNEKEYGQSVSSVEDLDNDGVSELVVLDASWEMSFGFCHVCSPGFYKIYKWDGTTYKEDTESKAYFAFHIQSLRTLLNYWKTNSCDTIPRNDDCLSTALEVLLEYDALGKRSEGWSFFWKNTTPNSFEKSYDAESSSEIRATFKKQYDSHLPFSPKI